MSDVAALHALDSSKEAPFSFEELFFSRTDTRGIIHAGNSVFQRISQYEWDELLKKPHNIIRHPDMPKGVFYLLWDFIKQGKPIGAYVKNRAKDGRYYWVFAVVTPVEGGYLSVRLKPSSMFFNIVEKTYKTLLAYEYTNKSTPKESMEYLFSMIQSLGFEDYDAFMSVAIRKEMQARDHHLHIPPQPFLQRFEELSERASVLMQETASVFASYEANQYVPMNLQIQSAQLGEEGKTIGVISGNFSIVSQEIQQEIDVFNQSAREMFSQIYDGQFLICVARIQQEVVAYFTQEKGEALIDNQHEMRLLLEQLASYQQKAAQSLQVILQKINRFQDDCGRMKKCAASLEVIRVMGKVDAARITNASSGLNELIDELGNFQSSISQSLNKIDRFNSCMRQDTEGVIASLEMC